MIVVKRDGTRVSFSEEKIRNAVSKANDRTKELTEQDLDRITAIVVNKISRSSAEQITVEEIQDFVEDTLLKSKFNTTAKSYIIWRDQRTNTREKKTKLLTEIAKKINATNIVNQNANVDEASFGGRKGEADSELMKWYALNNCVSKKARENHLNNEIYIHDLSDYPVGNHNCLSVPFDKLLAEGFKVRQTDVRPAGSIATAFQLVAVIFQLQSLQQFGGVSATHLDWTMVPYVKKSFRKHYLDGLKYCCNINAAAETFSKDTSIDDLAVYSEPRAYRYAMDLTTKELDQSVESLYHNLNTLQSRSGNQLPFTSINYGTCTLSEGRMVIKALLDGSLAGVGMHHLTPIFPCGIFQCKLGVNRKPGDPNYDLFRLALKSTAKRIYPNYCNCDFSNQVIADTKDIEVRQQVLDSLSEEEQRKLIIAIKEHPELSESLGIELED